ncbi:MAG: LysE family transporter [Pseudomonadota bacterium]
MTPLAFIALGILGGIFVTAPLGPVNVLIMQRALRYGFLSGAAAGVGAAVADVVFASAAAFSVSTVSAFVEGHARLIQLIGGLLVAFIGARILWRQPGFDRPLPEEPRRKSAAEMAVGTFFLTITNPATIFGFVAYFGALGEWAPEKGDYVGTAQLILGVAIGTLGWWCGLAAVVTQLRVRLTEARIAKFNVVAGALLLGFGALILGRLSVTYFEVI